jgi:hypothetical protein
VNRLPLLLSAGIALSLVAVPAPLPAQSAGTGIQRCVADDGTAIYTDKACGAFGATAAPIRGELLNRLASTDTGADTPIATAPAAVGIARRSPASGCARTPTQLAMDLHGAWALGDVNRIAESYHWAGMDADQGRSIMQRLERLAGQTLWDTEFFDARIGSGMLQFADASAPAATSNATVGVMQLVFDDGATSRVQDLQVQRYNGCYFVRF